MRKQFSLLLVAAVISASSLFVTRTAQAADAKFKVSEFTFTKPASWETVEPTSSMRAAQFKVGDAKASAEVVFFYFGPGGAGGTQANIDRWLGQFTELKQKKTEATSVGKTKVTYVTAEGAYSSGMPGGPKTTIPDAMLFGGIVEGEQGHVFIKMTGPAGVAKGAVSDFKKMVESALK